MEKDRLTERDKYGHAYFPECFKEPCLGSGCAKEPCELMTKVCEKLAKHEDTGWIPVTERLPEDISGTIQGGLDMEMSLVKRDGKIYTRFKIPVKDFKSVRKVLEIIYRIDTYAPVKENSRYKYFEKEGDWINVR